MALFCGCPQKCQLQSADWVRGDHSNEGNWKELRDLPTQYITFLRWVVEVDNGSSQQRSVVLRVKMQVRKANSFATTTAIADPSLLWKPMMEQVSQVPRASPAMHTYVDIDRSVSEWFLKLFVQQSVSPAFSNENTFLQRVWSWMKGVAKSIFRQYDSKTTVAIFLFPGIAYVSSCIQDCLLQTRLH